MIKLPFQKQKPMQKVLTALIPVLLSAVYLFGLRVLAVLLICLAAAYAVEWFMASRRNAGVTQACFVTGTLYALSLPPTIPYWIAAAGMVVGILFGKEAFGGFGKNVFNPAIVGRAFVWISFPVEMTSRVVPAFQDFPGGFMRWSMEKSASALSSPEDLDALTSATPMSAAKTYGYLTGLPDLFTGLIGGVFKTEGTDMVLGAGSMGEASALAIMLGAGYLIYSRAARIRLILSPLLGALLMAIFMRYGLGLAYVPNPLFVLFSGGLLFAAVFMVTEPVTAPGTPAAQWIYGLFIGIIIVLLRYQGIFTGAVAFGILLGNMLAPSLDLWFKRYTAWKKKRLSRSSAA
ncbi:MAG: RnfABCDGE type electron transport complex subunit D [Desulfonatronovibrionaceae bacterium]